MISTIQKQTSRLINWKNNNPKKAIPILAVLALLVILLISTFIAFLIKKDSSMKPPANSSSQQQVAEVTITKDSFIPATLVVKKGTKIVWTNNDESIHQIQANPHPTGESLPGLKSEILNNAQTYEYTADTAGTFGYHDYINPTTNGTIEVTE